jgi:peptide/nickel transport system ATP-binding protein/oligopeptide transport system ATP-binding protein
LRTGYAAAKCRNFCLPDPDKKYAALRPGFYLKGGGILTESNGRRKVLSADNVSKNFPIKGRKDKLIAVSDVSLSLYDGETYGLVGETGCGKSTLGRTLIRLLEPDGGSVHLGNRDITHLPEKNLRPLRRELQMIFQDPYTSLNPRKRAGHILMEALTIHKAGAAGERMEMAMTMLNKVGLLPEHFYRYPYEFSGGQRQRIGMDRALILHTRIVICDEPVSALDVSVQSQILNLLRDLREDSGLSYLFIAHDISVISYISDRIGVMYLGHIVEEAETEELFRRPLHPYTQALLSAVPSTTKRQNNRRIILKGDLPSPVNPPPGCPFHTRCPKAKVSCGEIFPLPVSQNGHKTACLYID